MFSLQIFFDKKHEYLDETNLNENVKDYIQYYFDFLIFLLLDFPFLPPKIDPLELFLEANLTFIFDL